MESRWRQNVADLGMSYTDWKLCARMEVSFLGYPTYLVRGSDPDTVGMFHPLPGEVLSFEYLGPFTVARFPGPFEVEPDQIE